MYTYTYRKDILQSVSTLCIELNYENGTELCDVIAVCKIIQIPQVLTYRMMFGIYYHSIVFQTPLTSSLISLSSVDTEEKREFSAKNPISKSTSRGHPEHIIPNSILRVEINEKH